MSEPRWIVIPKWERFHHRDMARTKVPPWVRNLTRLMSNDDYLALSFHQRGILHSIWLEYARSLRQLSGSTVGLSRRLGQRVTSKDLEALNHAGFIEFSASKPASNLDSRLAGTDGEKKKKALRLKTETKDTAKPFARTKRTQTANAPSRHDDMNRVGEHYDFAAELARAQAARAEMND